MGRAWAILTELSGTKMEICCPLKIIIDIRFHINLNRVRSSSDQAYLYSGAHCEIFSKKRVRVKQEINTLQCAFRTFNSI